MKLIFKEIYDLILILLLSVVIIFKLSITTPSIDYQPYEFKGVYKV